MSTGIFGGHFLPIALSFGLIETSIPSSRPATEQAGARSEGQGGSETGRGYGERMRSPWFGFGPDVCLIPLT